MSEATASTVHRESTVIDAHCDSIFVPFGTRRDLAERGSFGHVDVPRLLEGGVTGQFMALLVNDEHHGAARALEGLDIFYDTCARCPDLVLATTAADIRTAKAQGRVAALLALESSDALEGQLSSLRMFYRLGIRSISLTHNVRNRAADGILEAGTGGGLSEFGRQVVQEAERLGMLLDISHLSPAGVKDVFALSRAPIIASHSNAYGVWPNPRNLTDAQLEGLARRGGVVCITYVDKFLTDDEPTLEHVLDHIEYVVRLIGAEYVGIGSDYDGFTGPHPQGLGDVTCLPSLTAGLLARGLSPEQVRAILGGNLLRVIGQVCG
ncbi:MAG: dipeptidase [Anaerolineae bacterium]